MSRTNKGKGTRSVLALAVLALAATLGVVTSGASQPAGPGAALTVAKESAVTARPAGNPEANFDYPQVAINPANADNIVVASRIDVPEFGCEVRHSTDGGRTWAASPRSDGFEWYDTDPERRCWSPGVAFGDENRVYVVAQEQGGKFVKVHVSEDGGATFVRSTIIPKLNNAGGQHFQANVAVFRGGPGAADDKVYTAFYDIAYFSPAMRPGTRASLAVLLSVSTDEGKTFSTGAVSYVDGESHVYPHPVPHPTDPMIVYVVYKEQVVCFGAKAAPNFVVPASSCPIMVLRSSDGGATFEGQVYRKGPPATGVDSRGLAQHSPDLWRKEVGVGLYRDIAGGEAPGMAITPSGTLIATWASEPATPRPECGGAKDLDVLVSRSTDNGENWSSLPLRINDDDCAGGASQRNPWVSVAPNGRVDITFSDNRNDPDHVLYDAYVVSSSNDGQDFGANRRVSGRSFDSRIMFLFKSGSYQSREFDSQNGIASTNEGPIVAWGDARNRSVGSPEGDPDTPASDVYASRVRLGPASQPKPAERITGVDRYQTAVAVSEATYAFASELVVAPGDSFAEPLAAGPLARKVRGPVLLTRRDVLPESVKTEITRLTARAAAPRVYVVGGPEKVSVAVEEQLRALNPALVVIRVAGANSYGTAQQVAATLGPSPSGTAVIASGEDFAETLAASAFAAFQRMPVLLVDRDNVPPETTAALAGITKTIVVGSAASISDGVVASLPGARRVAGANGHELAANLAILDAVPRPIPTNVAYVASGTNYPDALAAAPSVAYRGGILLLADEEPASEAFLATQGPRVDQLVFLGTCGQVRPSAAFARVDGPACTAPSVTSVTPDRGPVAGGQSVTIRGARFTGSTAVTFGGARATGFTVQDEGTIAATTPAHAPGPVDVRVSTPEGRSPVSAKARYTYVLPPAVAGLRPDRGPTTGGTAVEITGTDFTGASEVRFAERSVVCPSIVCAVESDTVIRVITPPHTPGAVLVAVVAPGGISQKSSTGVDLFTYFEVTDPVDPPPPPGGDLDPPPPGGEEPPVLPAPPGSVALAPGPASSGGFSTSPGSGFAPSASAAPGAGFATGPSAAPGAGFAPTPVAATTARPGFAPTPGVSPAPAPGGVVAQAPGSSGISGALPGADAPAPGPGFATLGNTDPPEPATRHAMVRSVPDAAVTGGAGIVLASLFVCLLVLRPGGGNSRRTRFSFAIR